MKMLFHQVTRILFSTSSLKHFRLRKRPASCCRIWALHHSAEHTRAHNAFSASFLRLSKAVLFYCWPSSSLKKAINHNAETPALATRERSRMRLCGGTLNVRSSKSVPLSLLRRESCWTLLETSTTKSFKMMVSFLWDHMWLIMLRWRLKCFAEALISISISTACYQIGKWIYLWVLSSQIDNLSLYQILYIATPFY